AFILFTSNPFARQFPPVTEGRDLNPLLQDPGLAIHPPMLYLGYVGFSVVFAFAIAALITGRLDMAWARWSRPWTTTAWSFLTLGIALGSWWAYYELGWGGWWFWDPVENASFMPWLIGTALIHTLAATEKRGVFKAWTVLLAVFAFSLSLLGTFLVRSGVLTSVHAFASDPERGLFILIFLIIVVGGSLTLYAWRAPGIRSVPGFNPVSREGALLINNVLLVTTTATVLLGTLY
ncbi:MAG: cytochrome c biogenesis protein CcsA, partial [Gammaproteobacteria bacterium]|nr:cytochrome c biogenesis protein CcsA [Gammaproteobacteria bacterium]